MHEAFKLFLVLGGFLICWFLPVESSRFQSAIHESFVLVKWYAREHVLLCLVPAFFIAGAIGVFVRQGAVMKYLGPDAKKIIAYPVAAISGTILAVCSCTVLPLFSSIHKRGAGLGPATAFLYSGPAINVLAIILTARVLGLELGIARAVGAISFSVIIGLLMHLIFRRDEAMRSEETKKLVIPDDRKTRTLWMEIIYFLSMVAILVFANWARPTIEDNSVWTLIFDIKWYLTAAAIIVLILSLLMWFQKDELFEWTSSSWTFAKQILPLLLGGVLMAGFLLGSQGNSDGGVVPSDWVASLVGGNSVSANFCSSVVGAFMYFATLTEVPILEGLIRSGMGKGPALALLLAGPALSLPSMLVIRQVLGTKKTVVYVSLVIVLSTLAGILYGAI